MTEQKAQSDAETLVAMMDSARNPAPYCEVVRPCACKTGVEQ
jgi:hypothetical protein